MNIKIVLGRIETLVGTCQRTAARAIGNEALEQAGRRRCIAGKEHIAIGEAQRIIKQYIARLQTR